MRFLLNLFKAKKPNPDSAANDPLMQNAVGMMGEHSESLKGLDSSIEQLKSDLKKLAIAKKELIEKRELAEDPKDVELFDELISEAQEEYQKTYEQISSAHYNQSKRIQSYT